MKRMVKCLTVVAILLALVSCGKDGGEKVSKEKVYTLKVSTTQNEIAPIVRGLQKIADKIKKETNGGLNLEIYPAGQLGVEEDIIEQALQGVNVAVLTDSARMSNYVPEMGILNMAYFVDNYDEALKILESDMFKGWENELVNHDIRVLSFNFYDGARSFMTKKEVKTPEDLKGLRIRTPGTPVWTNSIESLGATPVAMSWGEVYNGIQSNALDGCEVQYTSAYSTRIFEVTDWIAKTEHIQLINGLVTGEKWFSTLPEEYKEILLKTAKDLSIENARYVESLTEEIEYKLKNEGMIVVDVDKTPFKAGAEKAYEKMGWTDLRKIIYDQIGK